MGREWIEIPDKAHNTETRRSPSLGREWIEIELLEGTDVAVSRLPPWGGSGLKLRALRGVILVLESPSLGREWIEIK